MIHHHVKSGHIMKHLIKFLFLCLPFLLLAACRGNPEDSNTPIAPEGPALIMFYTDN